MARRSRTFRRKAVIASGAVLVLCTGLLASGATPAGAQAPAEAANPDITITQTVDQATVVAGDVIDYHLLITNTGDVALTGVTVLDPKTPDCAGPVVDLAVGDDVTVDCSYTTVDPDDVGTRTNAAAVTTTEGALALSNTVSTTVEAPTSELTVTKSATQTSVVAGDVIDFQVVVENTGNLDLTGVAVTDANVPDCDSAVGALAPGATSTIDCTYTTGPSDVGTFSNIAAAVSDQTTSVDSNQVDVTVAAESFGLTAALSVDQASIVAGEDLDYHIDLENTGNRTLTGLTITDADAPDCAGPVADLAPGGTTTIDCTYTTVSPGDVGTYTNTATVASNEAPDVVTNQVSSTVAAQAPGITIAQAADQNSVFASQDIDLHITLHNTGNMTLTGVVIIDNHAPDCAGPVPDIAAGATTVIDCTYTAVLADAGTYHNTAAVDTNQTALLLSNQISVHVTVPTCGNEPVDVSLFEGDVPTQGHDVILGTHGDDVINSLGGRDFICALEGNDTINAGSGNDLVLGMAGNDNINGGSGNDEIYGMENADTINGAGGNDPILAGPGTDTVNGGPGNDNLLGEAGNDTMNGDDGDDFVNSGLGNDTVTGGHGVDYLRGGDGDDLVSGNDDIDHILGGQGVDIVNGGTGNDNIDGSAGNDTVRGGDGNDIVRGATGNDRLEGGNGNDILFGDDGNDTLFGQQGIDRLLGHAGNDHLDGGTGPDGCYGGTGTDSGLHCEDTEDIP